MGVQELAARVRQSQPLVSHHLAVLRRAGLVTVRRAGRLAVHCTTAHPVVAMAIAVTRLMNEGQETPQMTTTEHAPHTEHDHAHGDGCGHVAVPHGDHVDYLHDGHRHAAHDGHYDDH